MNVMHRRKKAKAHWIQQELILCCPANFNLSGETDASLFGPNDLAGLEFILKDKQKSLEVPGCRATTACTILQAEYEAILEALYFATEGGLQECTDSLPALKILNSINYNKKSLTRCGFC